MGNVPVKRPPSRNGTSRPPLRRSKSVIPPSHLPTRRPSLHESDQYRLIDIDSSDNHKLRRRDSSNRLKSKPSESINDHVLIDHRDQCVNLSHPPPDRYLMTVAQREMIRSNWEANRDRRYDIARRIYGRAFNKRPDIREIYESMGLELWMEEACRFADFVELVIDNVDDLCAMERLCLELGRRHSDWRHQGFKPEFWVALAESMTKECVYLDAAVHPAGEVLQAWSKLVGLIFGWARDGYYEKVRYQRQQSRKNIFKNTSIIDSVDDQTANNITNGIQGIQLSSVEGSDQCPVDNDLIGV